MATEIRPQWQQAFEEGKTACAAEDFANAEPLFARALNLSYDECAPDTSVAEIFFSQGWCFHAQKKFVEAQRSYGQALATFERCRGTSSIEVAEVLQNLGSLLCEIGRASQAQPLLDRAFMVIKRTYGEDNPEVLAIKEQIDYMIASAPAETSRAEQPPPAPTQGQNNNGNGKDYQFGIHNGEHPAILSEHQEAVCAAESQTPEPACELPLWMKEQQESAEGMPAPWADRQAPEASHLPADMPPLPDAADLHPQPALNSPALPACDPLLAPPLPESNGHSVSPYAPPLPQFSACESAPAQVGFAPPLPETANNIAASDQQPVVSTAAADMLSAVPPLPADPAAGEPHPISPSTAAMLAAMPPLPADPAVSEPHPISPSTAAMLAAMPPLPADPAASQPHPISPSTAAMLAAMPPLPAVPEAGEPHPISPSTAAILAAMPPLPEVSVADPQPASVTPQYTMPPLPVSPPAPVETQPTDPAAAPAAPNTPPSARRRLPKAISNQADEVIDIETYDELVAKAKDHQGHLSTIEDLVHPREKMYGSISKVIGWMAYGLSILMLFGIFLLPVALLAGWILGGICKGHVRGHSVKISDRQFPEVHKMILDFSEQLGMAPPQVYVCHYNGILNAFTQRFQQQDFVVISSDVFELAYQQGEKEIAFVIAHELAHVRLAHVKWAWLHIPSGLIPFFGSAYSRACEYSCDRIARYLVPDGALFGLVALAAGTHIYKNVNLRALYQQQEEEWDFWTWFAEIQSSHPNLVNRIRAIGIADDLIGAAAAHGPAFSRHS